MYEITIKIDENDADYRTATKEITEEELNQLRPLFEAIKNFKPYKTQTEDDEMEWTHSSNFPYGEACRTDLGEKTIEEIYSDFDEDTIYLLIEGFLPSSGEYGFHSIVSVEVGPIVEREKLI